MNNSDTFAKAPMLVVNNITKNYGKQKCLNGASFAVYEKNCIGIVGVNGSGKSTLLSIIAGVTKPTGGEILLQDVNILKQRNLVGKYIGYVPQENPLIEDLTVLDNLLLWYCDSPYDLHYELESGFLKTLGINEYKHKTVSRLSGGMKKRVSIAIAVHNAPKILLLDEPSAALDLLAKKAIRDYLKDYISNGGCVVIVTHDEDELNLCDNIYVVNDGILKSVSTSLRGEALLNEISYARDCEGKYEKI